VIWADDLRRAIYSALAAADDEATRLAATVPLEQARDAALDAVGEAAKALVRDGFPGVGRRLFEQASRVADRYEAARSLRAVECLQRGDFGRDAEHTRTTLAKARAALEALLSVYAREELEPTYELEQVGE
jgi:hypothetical protein